MTTIVRHGKSLIDWHVTANPNSGESVAGGGQRVETFSGVVLLAVVDGVGHGHEATVSARTAVAIPGGHPDNLLIFATGVHAGFDSVLNPGETSRRTAERIHSHYGRGTEHALTFSWSDNREPACRHSNDTQPLT